MAGKLSAGATIVQVTFIIFNILFSIVGAIVLALGIYLVVEGQSYDLVAGNEVASGAGLLIAAGVITFCIAAVGFIGACFKWRPFLIIFAVVLVLIVLLEIVAAIVGVVHRSQLTTTVEEQYTTSWQDAIGNYRVSPDEEGYMEDVNNAVDTLQERLECCGGADPSDWGTFNAQALDNLNQMLPSSCNCTPGDGVMNCGTVMFVYNSTTGPGTNSIDQIAWTVGCVNATIEATRALFVVAIGTGFVIGIIEIFGIIISLSLVCCITSSLRKEII